MGIKKKKITFLAFWKSQKTNSLSQALPLCRYTDVMELAVGRLGDKSVHVCKSAIQLVAAFIAHNPYSCKVNSSNPPVCRMLILGFIC